MYEKYLLYLNATDSDGCVSKEDEYSVAHTPSSSPGHRRLNTP